MNWYGTELKTWKAALHMHSTTSDGQYAPQELIDLYASKGFDILAFSDHWKTNRVEDLDPRGMSLISGIELHPAGPRGREWHILALHVPFDFNVEKARTHVQKGIDMVNDCGGIAVCAHPYWCGFSAQDVAQLDHVGILEVYNTSCRGIGKEYNMQVWDDLLDMGLHYNAIAVDDTHFPEHLFFGWSMIASPSSDPASVVAALRMGRFYATQGPEIKALTIENGIFHAEFTPVVNAILVGKANQGLYGALEAEKGPDTPFREVSSVDLDLKRLKCRCGDYVRLQLKDARGRMAWSNPVWL